MKRRILLVDDSPSALLGLERLLSSDPRLEIVGRAASRNEAVALAEELRPDLVTMDVYLGGQDGVDVAREILKSVSTRIVMVTGLDQSLAQIAFRALAVGALDVLSKPSPATDPTSEHRRRRFVAAIFALSGVHVVTRRPRDQAPQGSPVGLVPPKDEISLLALGASTGGPPVLNEILRALPRPFPAPIVIVQHIEPSYVGAFAEWLSQSGHPTSVIEKATLPRAGQVYIAPGRAHAALSLSGLLKAEPGEPRQFHLPSIDVFFESLAEHPVVRTFAALLSGMGSDGAEGLARLTDVGATTAVQSLESCVVPGMPQAALHLRERTPRLTPLEIAAAATRFFGEKRERKELHAT